MRKFPGDVDPFLSSGLHWSVFSTSTASDLDTDKLHRYVLIPDIMQQPDIWTKALLRDT